MCTHTYARRPLPFEQEIAINQILCANWVRINYQELNRNVYVELFI
jgi:hypothetical protein